MSYLGLTGARPFLFKDLFKDIFVTNEKKIIVQALEPVNWLCKVSGIFRV